MTPDTKQSYLLHHPLFANVSQKNIADAAAIMKLKTVQRSEAISYGDGAYSKIYLLFQGKVKLASFTGHESEMIKDIIMAPDVFGNLTMDGLVSKLEYAEAMTINAVVGCFTIVDFKRLLEDNPMMGIAYAGLLTGKLERLEGRHAELIFCDTKSRLVQFIKKWAKADGLKVGNNVILKNYLTHADIANVISSSRQSVNILLNELRADGMLMYSRSRIELHNASWWH
jgi:CRP/FNR family cyclic AMP-dependent transcriptional regulator